MKADVRKIFKNGFAYAWALAAVFTAAFVVACSDSKDVAGGTSEDAGIIAELNAAGVAQKGPFVKGSAVTLQGVDCKTMELTDEKFEGSVKSDKGDYEIKDVSLSAACAVFEVSGNYWSEISGKKSSEKLTLHALTNLKDRKRVNINVLTDLEYGHVMNLVAVEKMSFDDAKKQAEKEVLESFGIAKAGEVPEFENLNFFEKGDGNAALLAVSVMVLASAGEKKLAERMEEYADAISKNGSLDEEAKKEIEKWAANAAANGELDTIRKNIESWGDADELPAFEKHISAFADSVTLSSGEESSDTTSSSSSSFRVSSSSSKNVIQSSSEEPSDTTSSSSSSSRVSSSSSKNVILSSSEESSDTTSSSSSSSRVSSSSETRDSIGFDWNLPKQSYFNPNIKYDSIVDRRDGKVYKTVQIGSQVWMAENLNYADSARTPSLKGKSWCYDDVDAHCDVAGRLYTWTAAIDSVKLARDSIRPLDCGYNKVCGLDSAVQGICPDGWHLPTAAEWDSLISFAKPYPGEALKSTNGWFCNVMKIGEWIENGNGLNTYGFTVLPAGVRRLVKIDGEEVMAFEDLSDSGWFWGVNEGEGDWTNTAEIRIFGFYYEDVFSGSTVKNYASSVRCLKN